MSAPFYENGLQFSCTQCSACCRYEQGIVLFSENDLKLMCEKTNLSKDAFIETYCIKINTGLGEQYSLKEKENHDCIFWTNGCTIYEARPVQCKTYPFWRHVVASKETWKEEAVYCPGIGNGTLHSKEEIEACLALRLDNPPIIRS